MKKIIFILLVLLLVSAASCQKEKDNSTIVLDKDKVIDKNICIEKNLDNKIIQLESKFCGHCATVKPILENLAKENNVEITFLDSSDEQDREIIDSYNLQVLFTPTLIIDCKVVVGGQSEETYKDLIKEFLENE